ncbi:MAG: nitrous oxide reductase family maturation protein NosD [Candidatus Hodarchaeota archaeon]
MKSKVKSKLSLILIIIITFLIFSSLISKEFKLNSSIRDTDDIKISVASGKIHIENNWTNAKSVGICTGAGTSSNPYVIKNLEIDGGGSGICILIENSVEYFIIRNCIVSNSGTGDAGIKLSDVDNGKVTNNEVRNCGIGIVIESNSFASSSNLISGNQVHDNSGGIQLYGVSNNEVTGNIVNDNNGIGIYFSYGDYNTISENNISNNFHGIYSYANWDYKSEYNTISKNLIRNNSGWGLFLVQYVNLNDIFQNCFIDNGANAFDDGSNNNWDNGIKGNYWSDYTGSDSNNDGIGDSPHDIIGPAGSQDNFPLMKCPISERNPIGLIIIISAISGGAVLGIAAFLLIRRKRKRSE